MFVWDFHVVCFFVMWPYLSNILVSNIGRMWRGWFDMVRAFWSSHSIICSKEVEKEVDRNKVNYMFVFHHQNAGQNHNSHTGNNKSFINVTELKYL